MFFDLKWKFELCKISFYHVSYLLWTCAKLIKISYKRWNTWCCWTVNIPLKMSRDDLCLVIWLVKFSYFDLRTKWDFELIDCSQSVLFLCDLSDLIALLLELAWYLIEIAQAYTLEKRIKALLGLHLSQTKPTNWKHNP